MSSKHETPNRTGVLLTALLVVNAILLPGVLLASAAAAQSWNVDASGNWTTGSNWSPATAPNGVDASATFGPVTTAARTVTVDAPITLGSLSFSGSRAYTLSGGNALSFDVTAGSAQMTVSGSAAHTISAPINLADTLAVSQGSSGTLNLTGAISGSGGLTFSGAGSSRLGASNSFLGPTQINSGSVFYGAGGAIPSATTVSIGDGVGASGSARLNIDMSMSPGQAFAVNLASDGLLFQGNNRFTRLNGVSGTGELRVNSAVGNGFEFTGTNDGVFAGLVSGGIANAAANPNAGSRILKTGTGTQSLSGANTYVAQTYISGGSLQATNAGALGATSTGLNNATFVYSAGTLELAGSISVAERIYLNGAGTAGIGALRSFSGSNTLTNGVTLGWSGGGVSASNVAIGGIAGTVLTINGAVDGSVGLSKVGDGLLVLNGPGTWTGGTTFGGGTLRQGSATALPGGTALTFSGGTFDLNGFDRTITNLSGSGGLVLGSAELTLNQAVSGTFSGPISGTGRITKTGSGTLTLVGTNSYLGGTTVNAGTLVGDAASLQGNILNDAALVFDQSVSGTYAGSITGSGSLTKTGSGTLLLAGPQSYTGGTTVDAGVLHGSTASLQGDILNNGVVEFEQGTDGTYAGVLTGSGSLTKSGAGTLTLTGSSSYSGGTSISAGTLRGTTSSLQGGIVNDATLIFDQSSAGVFSGPISGIGALTKTGSGTLTLVGPQTYAGGTTVDAGTLRGDATSLQGDIVTNAVLVFDQALAGTYAGTLAGVGSVVKEGAGVLTLSGTSTYSGGTTVAQGTLRGNTDSLQGSILNDAELVFDQAVSGAFAGSVTGNGTLVKTGPGALVLTGLNDVVGGTSVAAGTLSVDGALFGPIIVESGATLAGTGSVGPVQVLSGGTISPGNSIGTLSLQDLDQQGVYVVEYRAPAGTPQTIVSGSGQSVRGRNSLLDPGLASSDQDADLLALSGSAQLAPGSSIALSRLGAAASFDPVFSAAGNSNREIRYLILRADGGVTGRYVALSESGTTLEYLNADGSPGDEDVWLVLRGADVPVIVDSAPAPYTLPMGLRRPRCDLDGLPQDAVHCAFVQGDLSRFDLDADGDRTGTGVDAGQGTVGFGVNAAPDLWLGLALGQEWGDADLSDGSGSADVDQTIGTLWVDWQAQGLDLRGWLEVGRYGLSTSRRTTNGALATSDHDADRVALAVELRRWTAIDDVLSVSPLLGLAASRLDIDGYTESGAGVENFDADSQSQENFQSLLGVEARWQLANLELPLVLTASAGWTHEFADTSAGLSGTYVGDATTTRFTSRGPSTDRDAIVAAIGATIAGGEQGSFRLEYGVGYSGSAVDQSAIARWSVAF
jgi:autotransporter-associated beta strand protein